MGPTVYFYEFNSKQEVAKASGASILLNYIPSDKSQYQSQSDKLYFYCDQNFQEDIPQIETSEKDGLKLKLDNFEDDNLTHTLSGRKPNNFYECEVDFKLFS